MIRFRFSLFFTLLFFVSICVVTVSADKEAVAQDAGSEDSATDFSLGDLPPDEDETEDDDQDDPLVDEPEPQSDSPAILDPKGEENASGYSAPSAERAAFFDDFQSGLSKWIHTSDAEYAGEFAVGQGENPTFKGDRALIITEKARRYGLSAKVDGLDNLSDKDLVVQYEVKLDQGMTCGGAYLKLPTGKFDPKFFNGQTTYSVMFGPDKCGATDKVHFIFQSKNPVTGKMTEHHLKEPPSVANTYDKKTHLYTLVVKSNGKFEVLVDDEVKKDGTLLDAFDPPVQPEKEIDDPEDKKPVDWIDEAKIPDPDATKPDDWDEDAPKEIDDMDAVKPEGWLDDEPDKVPDPEAKKPEEWDDEEDGEWEAPLVANPKCEEVGCGEWVRPKKANPDYKGKWSAPLIDNPKYVGEWKPRKIENKEYYDASKVHLLPVMGVGFEIWTMDQGVLFDNVWLGSDAAGAKEFAKKTFVEKQTKELKEEEEKNKKADAEAKKASKSGKDYGKLTPVIEKIEDAIDALEQMLQPVEDWLVEKGAEPYLDKLISLGIEKPMIVVAALPLVLVLFFLIILGGGKKTPPPPPPSTEPSEQTTTDAATRKKTDEPTPDEPTPDDTVENVDNSTAADGEKEKTTVRKRRTATAE